MFATKGAPEARAQTPPPARRTEQAAQADERVARGAYIVEDVAHCDRCHTPVNKFGDRDQSRWLMGGPLSIRPTFASPDWAIVAPRLAGAPPGTDEEFVRLLMTGISRTGRRPRPPMPQFRMTYQDAEAVLAYLKSLPGHEHDDNH
jgi:mono/diheme cytochrome c family protein